MSLERVEGVLLRGTSSRGVLLRGVYVSLPERLSDGGVLVRGVDPDGLYVRGLSSRGLVSTRFGVVS